MLETIAGRGLSPVLVLMYVRRLPDNSLTHALMQGDPSHFGWGQDRHLLADIYDAITFNTQATGNWTKPPDLPRWPRPGSSVKEKAKTTVASLWGQLNRR